MKSNCVERNSIKSESRNDFWQCATMPKGASTGSQLLSSRIENGLLACMALASTGSGFNYRLVVEMT